MKNPKNLNEVENLEENEMANTPNKDLAENGKQDEKSSEETEKNDGERRIETPQFPLEDDEIPDSDDPQEDIETLAP